MRAIDIIQPDLLTAGGMLETKRIADFAEFAAQIADATLQTLRKTHQAGFLPFLAGHAILPPVDRDIDVSHHASP